MSKGKPPSNYEKGLIDVKLAEGLSHRQISKGIKRSLDLFNRYAANSLGFGIKKSSGRPPLPSGRDKRRIIRRASNSQVTCSKIKSKLGLSVSVETVRRVLSKRKFIRSPKMKKAPNVTAKLPLFGNFSTTQEIPTKATSTPYQRARTPQHPTGGSPSAAHLQMHPHLQPQSHKQPRSPLVNAQLQGPGSVPPVNPATPQMMQQQMGMNQPMSLPPSHVSRPGSVAPPSSVPANLHSSGGGGPPSNQMDPMVGQAQYPMHLQPQQTASHPGSQQSQHISIHGGPQSVQQPGSIQRPGSVLAPGSHGCPPSHSAVGGPQSVQGYGPVHPPGSAQAPSTVPPGSTFAHGYIQAPANQQAPSSLQPPPFASSSAVAVTQNSKPLKPNEEQIRMVQDPVDLVRNLVQKDLRNSLVEMNKRGAELVRQKEEGDIAEEDKAQYKRATNDFHSVCDEIDRTLTTVMETAKQLSKLDKVFINQNSKELDVETMVNSVQAFVDNTEIVQRLFDETIGSVTASMEKMRRREKKWEDQQKNQKSDDDVDMS